MAAAIRFYLDENIPLAVADQLLRRNIAVVTVRELNLLGDSDLNHLLRATSMGYVLCTFDSDYVEIAASGIEHCGIVKGTANKHTIGDWVNILTLIHTVLTDDDMKNHVEYL